MATKRKKIEPITGITLDPDAKLTVQKSLPLFALWRSELTLAEFKILDAYLSRIDSRNPDKRAVRFEKGELEKILGVKKINTPELKERLKHLGTMVQVDDPTKTRSFRLVALFEQAECEQDEYGQWQVDLECTQKAMKYIFNVENLGYLRYKLRSIVNLTSRYSYILFLYLEQNRFRKTWEVGVDELRKILRCDDDETYKEFKRFNDRLLKRCYKELHEKTECRFTYEPIKKGRSVAFIRFTVKTLPAIDTIPGQMNLTDFGLTEDDTLDNPAYDIINALKYTCNLPDGTPEFSPAQMEELEKLVHSVPLYKLPQDTVTGTNGTLYRYHNYVSICYAKMNRIAEKTKIKNRFAYFCKIIKEDAEIE